MRYSEIIILYGGEETLVADLKDFLAHLGFSVSTITEKGSGGKLQLEKVKEHILKCQVAIVLATYDPSLKNSKHVRPNVLNELTLCLEYKAESTIVLREIVKKRVVDLGSNLNGRYIDIPFERSKLHRLNTALIKEFKTRNWVTFNGHDKTGSALNTGDSLRTFLDQMDTIWVEEFDVVNLQIIRHDWKTEKKFETNLDLFFWKYWDVFSAFTRDGKAGDELNAIINHSLLEALKLACNTWKEVAESRHEDFEDYREDHESDENCNLKGINGCLEQIEKIFHQAQNRKLNEAEKIALYKKAINLINECPKIIDK